MVEPWSLAALVALGVAAGFLNVVAGGGSLLTMPFLIFLGLPETTANGTTRVAILVQNLTAVLKYRSEGRLDLSLAARFATPAILGAGAGAYAATLMSDTGFRALLGWVMLGCAVLVAMNPKQGEAPADRAAMSTPRLWLILLVIGFYGGMIQAGVGYLILAGLTFGLGMGLVDANIMKVVIVFAYTPIALALFFTQGMVEWIPGLILASGQAVGAWLGAAATLRRGVGLIRVMLLIVVTLSAVELLGGFHRLGQLLSSSP